MYHLPSRNRRQGAIRNTDVPFNSLFAPYFTDFMGMNEIGFKADIREDENEYWIEAELPGLNKEDINIEIDNDLLTISASKNNVVEENKNNYVYRERSTGHFQRRFQLDNIKEDEIEAEYENGVLKIKLPKNEPGLKRQKTISIK